MGLRLLLRRPVAAAVIVSVVTLLVAGGIILTSTSLGCAPMQKLGVKGSALNRCQTKKVAAISSPTPVSTLIPEPSPSLAPTPVQTSLPSNTPPDVNPATPAYPPVDMPTSDATGHTIPTFNVSCRLPVYVGPSGSGGFIVFPGNTFIADPSSAVTTPSPSPESSPAPSPGLGGPGYGPGYSGLSYDHQFSRWVPVPPTQLAPDGAHYAFALSGEIYGHDVSSGATSQLAQGNTWSVIGASNDGAYAIKSQQAGLWFLSYSGTTTQLTTVGFWTVASSIAAYGTTVSAVPQGVATQIIRIDLRTKQVTNYFTRQGGQAGVIAIDYKGDAIMTVAYTDGFSETWDGNVALFSSQSFLYINGGVFADSHGVWFPVNQSPPYFQSTSGVLLYVPGGDLYWMSTTGGVQIGGACV